MSSRIRPGTKADLPHILVLIKELALYEKAPNEVEVSVQEMERWGFGNEKLFDFFVAEDKEKIIGVALYYYKYSTWKGKCLFLEDIIVTQTHRGCGIGSVLFEEVIKVAQKQQVRRMEWQVLNWNKPAIRFYEKYQALLDEEWINGKLNYQQLQNTIK
ncbi:MAG: GNAT family N-acetyltransferase [Bacteroidetes bacterium]|nr:GNAT family N-acetyltransferase [Bacteroidota bacterium]